MAIDPTLAQPTVGEKPTPSKLTRKRSLKLDRDAIAQQVIKEYDQDILDRQEWMDRRLQRYAKMRGWLEPKNYPWPNAANTHVPLMQTDSQRMQDTLHNAVLATRPVIGANAIHSKDKDKTEAIDNVLDYQLFVEQMGEEKVGELIDAFINDGTFVAYIPWVRSDETVSDVRLFKGPKEGVTEPFLVDLLRRVFPNTWATKRNEGDIFSWTINGIDDETGREFEAVVEFYADESDQVMLVAERTMRTFDGPCVIPKPLEDVVVPSRSANLQPPSPSNPGGAHHVILVDYPTKDEIKRLRKAKYYDLMTADDEDLLDPATGTALNESEGPQAKKRQDDTIAGQTFGNADVSREYLTRLTYFGRYDIDDDGLEEDVIFWVIKETRTLLRARMLTEMFPAYPPRRPFAEARMIPVPGQFFGIGMLELLEHTHDLMKVILDQSVDKNTLVNTPWGLYRSASGVRPEVIRMTAGELYPVNDPDRDVKFPSIPNPDQSFSINLMTLLNGWAERQAVIGELDFGRVPYGKASALRTASTTQALLQQGDARPERILRRFFRGLSEVYAQMHELNQAFLPEGKKYRIASPKQGEEPYRTLDDPAKIRGRFQFDFKANVMNTNRALKAQILQGIGGAVVNPLTMQAGIVTPLQIYNWAYDFIKSQGQDPTRYVKEPVPGADQPMMTAHEVMATIASGERPMAYPAEGAQAQLQKLAELEQDPLFAMFDQAGLTLYRNYKQRIAKLAQQEAQAQQMQQAAQQFQQGMTGGGQAPPGGGQAPQGQAPVAPNEIMDEQMPSAGGGASAGGPQ